MKIEPNESITVAAQIRILIDKDQGVISAHKGSKDCSTGKKNPLSIGVDSKYLGMRHFMVLSEEEAKELAKDILHFYGDASWQSRLE